MREDEESATRPRLGKDDELFPALVATSTDVVYRMSPDWSEMRALESRRFLTGALAPISDWVTRRSSTRAARSSSGSAPRREWPGHGDAKWPS